MTRKSLSLAPAILLALTLTVGGSCAEAGGWLRDRFLSQNGYRDDSRGGYYGLGHGRQIGNRGLYGGPPRQNVPNENGDYSEAMAKRYLPYANMTLPHTSVNSYSTDIVPAPTSPDK